MLEGLRNKWQNFHCILQGQHHSIIVHQKVEAQLKENEEKADQLTKHWLNKISEAQKIFKVCFIMLFNVGLACLV